VQFTLDQRLDAAAGVKWVYNSGTGPLMSAILRSATRLEAEQLAKLGYLQLNDGSGRDGGSSQRDGSGAPSTGTRIRSTRPGGYGYQWWRIDHRGVEVWAGLGYGGSTS